MPVEQSRGAALDRAPASPYKRLSLIFGVLFALTFVTSTGLTLHALIEGFKPCPILDDRRYAGLSLSSAAAAPWSPAVLEPGLRLWTPGPREPAQAS